MPTEPTPSEPSSTTPTPTDRVAHDGPTGETEPDGSAPSGVPESVAAPDRDDDPDTGRVAELERRVTQLEAELDAVRGLLDGVETVDERVERRASAALAKAETLEERFTSEEALIRERLPDTGEDCRREGVDGGRTGRRRASEPDPEGGPRAGSQVRDGGDQDGGRHAGTADVPGPDAGASTGPAGDGRSRPATANATDGGSAGPGAITSVGSARSNDDRAAGADDARAAGADDADRSLAARLRDAFR